MCLENGAVHMVTARDRVWAAALDLMLQEGEWRFTTRKLHVYMDDPPSHKTIQRTLRAMSELGYLTHSPGSPNYRRPSRLRTHSPKTA